MAPYVLSSSQQHWLIAPSQLVVQIRVSKIKPNQENLNLKLTNNTKMGVNKTLKLKQNAKTINCLNMQYICKRLKPQIS